MNDLIIFIFSFSISLTLLYFSLDFLKKNFADVPNHRSSHEIIKPNGGGFIFVLNSLFATIYNSNYVLLLSAPLSLIGILDDKFNLPRKVRFFVHALTSVSLVIYLVFNNYFSIYPKILLIFFLVLIGISIINFSNFMDGIDGLVGGCYFVIFFMAYLLVDTIYLPISASILAFLILNWYPSKLFMGDIGSTFLGSLFFTVILQCKTVEESIAFILFSFPLMFDAFICVIRRYKNGKNIFKPHRDHLYQRLKDNGLSHSHVTTLYIISTIFISFSYLLFGIFASIITTVLVLIIGILIDKKYALSFN